MNYGERLKAARKHAKLSQAKLAEMTGVSQANISKLELSEATGSEFTVQFSVACGVSCEWLAMNTGEMVNNVNYNNEDIKRAIVLMQDMPEYALKHAVKIIDDIAQFQKMATSTEAAPAVATGTKKK